MQVNRITELVIGAAIEVHKNLGPGLLESTYERCLSHGLQHQRLNVLSQVPLPIKYKGLKIDNAYKVDILVPGQVIVELKSVSELKQIHTAQLITYLKLSEISMGLIINFNVPKLLQGLKRIRL